ncbi:serine hydrolase domain-containing protein [Altererythrobacter sp. ZODW24]|uniref:serine hydrolase domain-containing protein n=1 Tax=Altererythrobacter sp. ZODW24 TaxID=2185142 RepID=UPI0013B45026|nr:serine hydrolase domain-containing protein [Altererythrobacter sp. ZODW24]
MSIFVNDNPALKWTLAPDVDPDVFKVECFPDKTTRVVYKSEIDEVVFDVSGDDRVALSVVDADGVKAANELVCTPPRIRYRGQYDADRPTAGQYREDIDPVLETYFSDGSAGVAAAVWKDGELVYRKSIGLSDVEANTARSFEEPFEIASVSKEFTAISILQLVEKGMLSLDDTVGKFIPELPYGDKVKIHHLLSHTSGLGSATQAENKSILLPFDRADVIKALQENGPAFEPGSAYRYGNAGMTMLAMIAEDVSGIDRTTYVRKHILEPAGMTETRFLWELSDEEHARFIKGYRLERDELSLTHQDFHPTNPFGAGDLVSTLSDLHKWHLALKDGTLISRSMFDRATTQVLLTDGTKSYRGFAFMIGWANGTKMVYNSGDINTHTRHAFAAAEDLSIILNTNVSFADDGGMPSTVRNQINGKLMSTQMLDFYGQTIDLNE